MNLKGLNFYWLFLFADMIMILVSKQKEQNWGFVTELEKKAADSKKLLPDKMDDAKDPSESLMNVMKKM